MKIFDKDIILDESLKLFSVYGYGSVTISEIAEQLGMEEDNFYKFYKSKSEIFNDIMFKVSERVDIQYNDVCMPKGVDLLDIFKNMRIDMLEDLYYKTLDLYLNDTIISRFRKMLTIDQYWNKNMSKIYNIFFIDGPLNNQEDIFNRLIDIGMFSEKNAKLLALKFYSPLFLLVNKYDHQRINEIELRDIVREHIRTFTGTYLISEENLRNVD